MTNPDYRALCAELVELSAPTDSIPQLAERLQKLAELANRARAALAQPEPVTPKAKWRPTLTPEDLELWDQAEARIEESMQKIMAIAATLPDYDNDKGEIAQSLRELVACWGQPQYQPISETTND
jgi:hypothetical protein